MARGHYKYFTLNARAWLLVYIVNLDFFRSSSEYNSTPLGFNRVIVGALDYLVFG